MFTSSRQKAAGQSGAAIPETPSSAALRDASGKISFLGRPLPIRIPYDADLLLMSGIFYSILGICVVIRYVNDHGFHYREGDWEAFLMAGLLVAGPVFFTVRRCFVHHYIELGPEALIMTGGFFRQRIVSYPYSAITWIERIRLSTSYTTLTVATAQGDFRISPGFLPRDGSYKALQDFLIYQYTWHQSGGRMTPEVEEALRECLRPRTGER